ncbi:MAG: hypothetical protein KGM98_06240, partial [Bacteroidota bacterium]|nr:hypothetical protein [Bacteroidota bacterium]
MHSILISLLLFFLAPLNWIVILSGTTLFIRSSRAKKRCGALTLALFWLFSNGWLQNLYLQWWQPAPVELAAGASFSCAIIPGGFASPDVKGNGY